MATGNARKNLQEALDCLIDSDYEVDSLAFHDLVNTAEELCHKAGLCISVALRYKQYPNTKRAKKYVEMALWYLE